MELNHYIFLFSIQNLSSRPIISWSEEYYVVDVCFFTLNWITLFPHNFFFLFYFLARKISILFRLLLESKSIILFYCQKEWLSVSYFIFVCIHLRQLKSHHLGEVCPTKTAILFSSLKSSTLLLYLVHYKVTVSFLLKEIESKVESDVSDGNLMVMCFSSVS